MSLLYFCILVLSGALPLTHLTYFLFRYQESQIQIPLGSGHLCGISRDILDKGLAISDNPLYNSRPLCYELISRVSFGIVLSIGAVLLAIWPNILPLQQHLAMAQVDENGSAPFNITTGVPANTTTGAPAHAAHVHVPGIGIPNHLARPEYPEPGEPPCTGNNCHD
jgi:hypothetical protein